MAFAIRCAAFLSSFSGPRSTFSPPWLSTSPPDEVIETSPSMDSLCEKIENIYNGIYVLLDRLDNGKTITLEEFNSIADGIPNLRKEIISLPEYVEWHVAKDSWMIGTIPIREFVPSSDLREAIYCLWCTLKTVRKEVCLVGYKVSSRHNYVLDYLKHIGHHYVAALRFLNA